MYTLRVINSYGADVTLTGDENNYQITNITGLEPPQAQVNISKLAGYDGGIFNSAQLNVRNLVITIRINGDVEANRIALYQLFPCGEQVTVRYKNSRINAYINGYINNISCPIFSNGEIMQISIQCPDTFFKSVSDFTKTTAANSNYIEFDTYSTALYSCLTTINFAGSCTIVSVSSSAGNTNIAYQFQTGDVLKINSERNNKSIILTRGGTDTDILGELSTTPVFPMIAPGANEFVFTASTAAAFGSASVKYTELYGGV